MTDSEVRAALLTAIGEATKGQKHPESLLKLAEAYAWVFRPSQSHGGGVAAPTDK